MVIKMRIRTILADALFFITCFWFFGPGAFAASPSSALLKAKQEAESRGQIFITSHDEIVEKAKKEGKLRVIAGLFESSTLKFTAEAFKKRYPFMELYVETIRGQDAGQRNLLEIKSGLAKDWDIVRTYTDFYS